MSNFYTRSNIDVVAVYDSNYNQLFQNARPLKGEIKEALRPMEHPIETGQIITDYKIVVPVDILLPVIVSSTYYNDTYQQIRTAYNNSNLLTVQTRVTGYQNMIISEMPHDEKPDVFNAITINIRFKQIFFVAANSGFSPANTTQVNNQSIGQQSGIILGANIFTTPSYIAPSLR